MSFVSKKNPKVIVIGAGLSGLTAAYRLKKEGMDVDLYEARDRVGGRVLSVYVHGKVSELGAHNINNGGKASNIYRLVDEFGLEVNERRISLNRSYFNGKELISLDHLLKERKFNPQTLKRELQELSLHSRTMKEVLDKIFEEDDPLYKSLAVRLAAYEGASIEKLSPIYIDTLFYMLLGGICLVHQGDDAYMSLVSLKEGNSKLPEKMAETLKERLHLNMVLSVVSKKGDGSFELTFHNGKKKRADILVLAIPCSLYEKIRFEENTIPQERLLAIQSVQYGTNAKILVPILHDIPKRAGLFSDDQINCIIDQDTLILYYTGNTSVFSEKTILDTYLQAKPLIDSQGIYSSTPFYAKDQAFVAYDTPVGYSWPNDPYVKGSYSYISPGQEALLNMEEKNGEQFKALFSPIQNLYFAGEHASILLEDPGTMEAACESGERAARAILKSL